MLDRPLRTRYASRPPWHMSKNAMSSSGMDLVPNKLQGGGEGEEGWNVEKCQRLLKGSGILVARWVMVYLPMLRKTKAFCGMPRTSRTYMYNTDARRLLVRKCGPWKPC